MSGGPDRIPNPWFEIPASDYEGHMGPEGVDQLSVLSAIFHKIYSRLLPARVAVLGSATGNGFEHVDPSITRRLVALDINPDYIEVSRRRFPSLAGILETVCAPAESSDLGRASLDLVYAALVFEYLEPSALLSRISSWLHRDGRLCAVLQLPSGEHGPVTRTKYASLGKLEHIMRLVAPENFEIAAADAGLLKEKCEEAPLKLGKRLYVGVFRRP